MENWIPIIGEKNFSKSLKLGGAHEGVFGDADEHLADVLSAEEGAEGRDEGLETVTRDRWGRKTGEGLRGRSTEPGGSGPTTAPHDFDIV